VGARCAEGGQGLTQGRPKNEDWGSVASGECEVCGTGDEPSEGATLPLTVLRPMGAPCLTEGPEQALEPWGSAAILLQQ